MPLPRNAKEMQYTGYEQSSEAPLNAGLKFLEECEASATVCRGLMHYDLAL